MLIYLTIFIVTMIILIFLYCLLVVAKTGDENAKNLYNNIKGKINER